MGPLIPQGIIDGGWSYVIAFVTGAFFGMILESSGFSSSRKIVGLFYGYDFTVLRVFFTATITAMIGLLYFNYMGWIDLSMVYFPPMYLWAAISGGLIMGLGFIMGGFCPGTGLCAVGIGKLDAVANVVGLYLGIFLFSEAYPFFEKLYMGNAMGNLRVNEVLGISSGLFAFLFASIALAAFIITAWIQKRVKPVDY
ncbi:MAG: YeeE/YedE family protein [Haliscomenobacter sp.]|nr:YeeE/YedE family protein [Haliscomenobacter sp.]MBK7478050.1 YeeE/YedE family protein [Haliscomenobacter sp.]